MSKRPLPPKKIPNKLSADEYFLLGIQYTLLGSSNLSLKAFIKAMDGHSQYAKDFLWAYYQRTGQSTHMLRLNRVQYFLVLLGMRALDLCVSGCFPILKSIWNIPGQASNIFAKVFKGPAASDQRDPNGNADALTFAISRTTIPGGLSADDYLRLGKQYKQNGWISQSQEALERAIRQSSGSQVAQQAEQYLRTKVPKVKVSLEIEQENLIGYHAMAKGDLPRAKEVFERMMEQTPNFEWPYLNLATAYYKDGQLDEAKFLLRKLLSINPEHVEAWDILARIYAAEFDISEAREAIAKAEELYSEDNQLKSLIDCLAALN